MALKRLALMFLLMAAEAPLPGLRIEPTGGGSILYVKNNAAQPLTAYLIELVDYPGSSYSFLQDNLATPIQPASEERTQIKNMTVGAVPDYVKMQAAIYADGTTAGTPGKVAQIIERRRMALRTTRELIVRLEQKQSAATIKQDLENGVRNSQTASTLLARTLAALNTKSPEDVLTELRASEQALATSKPPL